ncbi:hypothetical protein AB0M28_16275 [Streptomyces sp. NPDC051940]|uniref:hypothetical protein n=1 Tax=Streptomyces sp. NPDC051940 TaxID=3155675 RepID=UPI0034344CC1
MTYAPAPPPPTPDWAALAESAERQRVRRRRLAYGVGGLLAAGLAAGVAATALGGAPEAGDGGRAPVTRAHAVETAGPGRGPAGTADPVAALSTAALDTAPTTVGTFFSGPDLTVAGRTYTREAVSATRDCAAAHTAGPELVRAGCEALYRATYRRGGIAVTVGVAVFGDADGALRAKDRVPGHLRPLGGFCAGVRCRLTATAFGRYTYVTVTGRADGRPVAAADQAALTADRDVRRHVFGRLVDRGRRASG